MARKRRTTAAAADGGPLLVARGVRRTYSTPAGPVDALRGVDLEVRRGAFVAVTGPSGSGKSTLLHCLAGLDRIDGGTVRVEGTDLHALSDAERSRWRARRVGFVFQHSNLVAVLSAVENVELPLLFGGVGASEARRRSLAILDRLGLAARAAHQPGQLSGGEQQRVAVARAVVAEPAVVWADEPTGSLDTEAARTVVDLLLEQHADGRTLVLVTHDPALAALAPQRVHVRDGRLTEDRPADRGRAPAAAGAR